MADHVGPVGKALEEAPPLSSLRDAEQLELLRDQLPGRDAATAVQVARRTGPGRRPGSPNKRGRRLRDYILSKHTHPGIHLAETYDRPVDLLAAELGCDLLEAKKLQDAAALALLRYIESPMPVEVKAKIEHDAIIIMGGAPGAGAGELIAAAEQAFGAMEIFDLEEGDGYREIEADPPA